MLDIPCFWQTGHTSQPESGRDGIHALEEAREGGEDGGVGAFGADLAVDALAELVSESEDSPSMRAFTTTLFASF